MDEVVPLYEFLVTGVADVLYELREDDGVALLLRVELVVLTALREDAVDAGVEEDRVALTLRLPKVAALRDDDDVLLDTLRSEEVTAALRPDDAVVLLPEEATPLRAEAALVALKSRALVIPVRELKERSALALAKSERPLLPRIELILTLGSLAYR